MSKRKRSPLSRAQKKLATVKKQLNLLGDLANELWHMVHDAEGDLLELEVEE